MKFGDWLYADAPNKPGAYSDGRPKDTHVGTQAKDDISKSMKEGLDPQIMDTASSPVKIPGSSVAAEKDSRKRLNMDAAVEANTGAFGAPKVML